MTPEQQAEYDEWAEESVNGRFGYLACMVIGTEPKLGEDLGRILPINNPKPAVIYDRAKLRAGDKISGPAVVIEMDATTLILSGCVGTVDLFGNILIMPV